MKAPKSEEKSRNGLSPAITADRPRGTARDGATATGTPDPVALRAVLNLPKAVVTVVKAEVRPAGEKERSTDLLPKAVVVADSQEQATTEGEGQNQTLKAEIAHLPMVGLDLDKAPDLAVYHPIELGNENDLVTVVSVLAQKLYPVLAALGVPTAGVENKLGLVHYKQNLIFSDLAALPVSSGVLREPIGRKLVIGTENEIPPIVARRMVDIEVRDNGQLSKESIANIAGGMKALPAARGARI